MRNLFYNLGFKKQEDLASLKALKNEQKAVQQEGQCQKN